LRKNLPPEIILITPGVRPSGSEKGDQARVATPEEAISWGANFVVIGRPITSGATLDEIRENAARIAASF
jgi:orotidine-5'-phosphate decarboxylase